MVRPFILTALIGFGAASVREPSACAILFSPGTIGAFSAPSAPLRVTAAQEREIEAAGYQR